MSYEERGQWVYLAATGGTYIGYVLTFLAGAGGRPLTELDYQPAMLWAIGLGVAIAILGRILVEIVFQGRDGQSADIRDRDVGRYGEFYGGAVLGIGMVVPFALTLVEAHHFWIANAMYLVFAVASVVGTVVKLVAYRRGF